MWALPALPGAVHDRTAACIHGLIEALSSTHAKTFADKGYQGAGGMSYTPFKRHLRCPKLSRRQKAVNRSDAKIRALSEHAVAILKSWTVLTKLHCCPHRATTIVPAILVLQHAKDDRYTR